MILPLGILFAGLFGLALGSFLNVCASRWPDDEKVTTPRSHCRSCDRTLSWWENLPVLSWLLLGGKCRTCKALIGWRYPVVELSIGVLWAYCAWQAFSASPDLSAGVFSYNAYVALTTAIAKMIFMCLLVTLAVIDAENLWLPDRLTLPGIFLGFALAITRASLTTFMLYGGNHQVLKHIVGVTIAQSWFPGAVLPAGALLIIRWLFEMLRGQEGLGLGDVKLMAMLGGWIGIKGGILSFVIALGIGVLISIRLYFVPPPRGKKAEEWSVMKLPFGTFLCVGGIIAGLWGENILGLYARLSGGQ